MTSGPPGGDRETVRLRGAAPRLRPGVTGSGDQAVLDQMLAHAAAEHDLPRPSMAFIERVVIATRPVTSTREPPGHLQLVGAGLPARCRADHGTADRAGRLFAPVGPSGAGHAALGPAAAVTSLTDRPARAHRTYRHECWLYHGDTEFLDTVLPFVTDGLARHQPVMIALPQPRLHAVRAALGRDVEKVIFADMADLGANPARIIPAWRDFTEKYRGARQPLRGVGQPIWAGRSQPEVVEAQFHEALLNLAVCPDTPLWLLHPYDTATLPDAVIDEALRSHPVVAESGAYRGSTHYGGAHHARTLFKEQLPDPAAPTTTVAVDPAAHRRINFDISPGQQAFRQYQDHVSSG